MIQETIKTQLQTILPDLEWTEDFRTANDHTGTVYATGGFTPDKYEAGMKYPTYQVYIRSSDWDYAKTAAYLAYKELHKKEHFETTINLYKKDVVIAIQQVYVYFIAAASEPLRIGESNGIMEYSINFDVTLSEGELNYA